MKKEKFKGNIENYEKHVEGKKISNNNKNITC